MTIIWNCSSLTEPNFSNQDFFDLGYDLDRLKGIQKQKVKQKM